MSTEQTTPNTGRGLIFFNADGTVGGFITTADGERITVRGKFSPGGSVVAHSERVMLSYHKVEAPSEKHPVGRGLLEVDGVQEAISVFGVTTESGRRAHGLASSDLPTAVNAPF